MPENERGRFVLLTDLDGTLLRSARERREGDIAVDWAAGRPCAYLPDALRRGLPALQEQILVAAVTSRSMAQYRRIAWPAGCEPALAVTTNSGCLLRGRQTDPDWAAESAAMPHLPRLKAMSAALRNCAGVRTVRIEDGMMLTAVCEDAVAAGRLLEQIDPGPMLSCAYGRKVYLMPPDLTKGSALRRLGRLPDMAGAQIAAAGDTVLDLPMLAAADFAIVPPELAPLLDGPQLRIAPDHASLPEYLLRVMQDLAGG